MLFYSILIIVVIGVLIFGSKRMNRLPAKERKSFLIKAGLWALAVVVVGLVVMGRAHWLMGVLAAFLALAGRVAQFAQYVPMFKKLFGQQDQQMPPNAAPANQQMTREQAADILGVDVNASNEDVRLAHKKLMQKIHPDRGGSDALAKQINQAKDILIG